MSAPAAPAVGAPVAGTAPGGPARPGARVRRRTARWAAVVLAVALALGVAVWSTVTNQPHPDPLDPRNPAPEGAQAVARVLADQGVDVTVARSAEQLEDSPVDRDTTVVVTGTDSLSPSTLDRLRRHAAPGRLVLVEPSYDLVRRLDTDQTVLPTSATELDAACDRPVDGIDLDGLRLDVEAVTAYSGEGCFPVEGGAVVTADPDADVVLLGAGEALANDRVQRGDNAAVALRLLGDDPRLVWYVPDPADAATDETVSLGSLLPDWVRPGLWILALAALALVLWRVRRLGPLSVEALPVVVRAVETARSRGRMYRRGGDRAHAAEALRRAARRDLARRLRLDRAAPPAAVVAAVAHRLGTPTEPVAHLLAGPPPATDEELVRLAQELARLRNEVGHG